MSTLPPAAPLDPLAVLKGLAALRRLTGTYPPGHPMIGQKLKEIGDVTDAHLQQSEVLRIDVIRGDVFLDSVPTSIEGHANQQLLNQLTVLGVDSIHITRGFRSTPAGARSGGPTRRPCRSMPITRNRFSEHSRHSRTPPPASRSTSLPCAIWCSCSFTRSPAATLRSDRSSPSSSTRTSPT